MVTRFTQTPGKLYFDSHSHTFSHSPLFFGTCIGLRLFFGMDHPIKNEVDISSIKSSSSPVLRLVASQLG